MGAATATVVRPIAGGVPCRAAPVPSDASGCASGKKRRCFAPASRDSSACLAGVEKLCVPSHKRKMADNRRKNDASADKKILTVGGEKPINPAQELLHKRLADELDAIHRILKEAELISRGGGACKDGAPTAGKKERFLASQQRSEPMEKDGGNAPSAKKRKISTLVQKQIQAPWMSPEQRNQLGARLSSLSGEVPGHIVEFLQKHFGDPNTHGEIEINIDFAEDSILFELKTKLQNFDEESRDRKIAEDGKGEVVMEMEQEEEDVDICGLSPIIDGQIMVTAAQKLSGLASGMARSTAQAESAAGESIGGPATPTAAVPEATQSGEAKKVQNVQSAAPKPVVSMAGPIYKAKIHLELKAMEKTVLPDETIHQRDLQHFCIAEYGDPSIMQQLGLFLKVDS